MKQDNILLPRSIDGIYIDSECITITTTNGMVYLYELSEKELIFKELYKN